MSSETTRDRAVMVIATTLARECDGVLEEAATANPGWIDEWRPESEAILAALDAAGIRLAGEGEVVVDVEGLKRLQHDASNWRAHVSGNPLDAWATESDFYDPIGGSDGGE